MHCGQQVYQSLVTEVTSYSKSTRLVDEIEFLQHLRSWGLDQRVMSLFQKVARCVNTAVA